MQTLYYNTDRYMRHTGNVVDLAEYRRKLAQVQEMQDSRSRSDWEEEQPVRSAPRTPGSDVRRRCRGMMLDACASVGIVVMTLTFTLRVLGA